MKNIYVTVGDDGYINGVSDRPLTTGAEGELTEYSLTVEEDHGVLQNMEAWKIENGQLVSPPERLDELQQIADSMIKPLPPAENVQEIKALKTRLGQAEGILMSIMQMLMKGGAK